MPGAGGRADPAVAGGAPGAAGRCAGGVVFGRVREDFELLQQGLGHSAVIIVRFLFFLRRAPIPVRTEAVLRSAREEPSAIPAVPTISHRMGSGVFAPWLVC
jgi:hypothetical protein